MTDPSDPGTTDDTFSAVQITGTAEPMSGLATTDGIDLVRGTVTQVDDHTWTVVAYATPAAISGLQVLGIEVAPIAATPQDRRTARPETVVPGYKNSAAISSALDDLVVAYPDTCTKFLLNHSSVQGLDVPAVLIQAAPASKTPVLFTGGVHARELVPPDALLSFCSKLLKAFDTGQDFVDAPFTDATGVTYPTYVVEHGTVAKILNNFSLFVVPCANPDGRDFVVRDYNHYLWRKNRRADPVCPGVDINRNFPFAWDKDVYFAPSALASVSGSKNKCDETFRGYTQAPAPNTSTEPETQNLIDLVAAQNIRYLVDVHMFGRTVLYPWGMDTDQSTHKDQTFFNTALDGKRDGPQGTAYGEYIPSGQLQSLQEFADSMVAEIAGSAGSNPTAIARSTYTAQQSIGLYPTTGTFDDYTFAQQFLQARAGVTDIAETYAFTVECGSEGEYIAQDDGGFNPNYVTKYPKVEREVHAALFGLLNAI